MAAEIDAKRQGCNPLFAALWTAKTGWGMSALMRQTDKSDQAGKPRKPAGDAVREARLKAALKANMARRKAQAKARATGGTDSGDGNENKGE